MSGGQPLRVGFLGCGFVTRERHLSALGRVPELEVAAFCDPDPVALAAAAEGRSARRYTAPEELVNDPEVDAVAVCTPPADHCALAEMAIEAGCHVLVEKPLALALPEADRLIEAAQGSSLTAMMGHNLRWHRHLRTARELLASGKLGRLVGLRSVFSDPLVSRVGPDSWRLQRQSGGGIVVDRLIHHFDLWRFLTGEEVDEVFAMAGSGQVEHDRATVSARTRSGAVLSTTGMDETATTHEVTLYGDRGALHVDCYRFDGLTSLSLGDLPGAPGTRLRRFAESMGNPRPTVSAIRRGGDFRASYEGMWRAFAATARSGAASPCGLEEGREALAIALGAVRSASTREPVRMARSPGATKSVA